jgi:hypothetical protein
LKQMMNDRRIDRKTRLYRMKCRNIMLRLAAADRKKHGVCVSFEDLRIPFQDYHAMDLREKHLVTLGVDNNGRPGAILHREYRDMTMGDFNEMLDREIGKVY